MRLANLCNVCEEPTAQVVICDDCLAKAEQPRRLELDVEQQARQEEH